MIYIFDWLGDLIQGVGDAIGGAIGWVGNQVSSAIWEAMLQWYYETIYNAIADFFTLMGNMGAELFPGDDEAGGEMRTVGEKWNGKRVVNCIGLIKSYAWYDPESNEIVAGTNGFKDCGANSIWNNVTESGNISAMPDIPGLAVWMDGHIGVYIGNGEVVEAQGTNEGVVKTRLKSRPWKKWLLIPDIKYEAEENPAETSKTESSSQSGTGSHR